MPTHPILLIILDGFGYRTESKDNAIAQAHTPVWDELWKNHPHTTLSASHQDVGLPDGQMGNSEVGHLTMGAGRVVYQDLTRITHDIHSGEFYKNPILLTAFEKLKKTGHTLHILGLLSPGGVHSHEEHIFALINFAKEQKLPQVLVHPFLDGRDVPPKSAEASLKKLEQLCHSTHQSVQIGSLCGRYFALDRDRRYERTQAVYELLTENKAVYACDSALGALNAAYERNETDEFVTPTLIGHHPPIQSGDIVLFMNFRSDRARQLSYAFTDPNFSGFPRKVWPKLAEFLTLTEYAKDISAEVLTPPVSLKNMLGEYLEQHHLRQLRIAETEKYAHVTFFFNGGREKPCVGEDRILVPSPAVATYNLCPEMSAFKITEALTHAILEKKYDVLICNFANADMVGHSGFFEATVKAIEILDACLGKIISALGKVGGEAMITADHGNAEYMFDENSQQPHTAHTSEPVPFVFIGRKAHITHTNGSLADIAPTLLTLLDLPIPQEMTGRSLVALE